MSAKEKRPSLKGDVRKVTGRKVKKLRAQGVVPANVFGKKIKSIAISVDAKEFDEVYSKVGETGLVDLAVGKKDYPVLVASVQTHPVTDMILHADFNAVDLTEKVTATVPIEAMGESPAEKTGVGTVVIQLSEVEVEALPADLPEKFEVDLSGLAEVDQAIKISDLKYDKGKVRIEADSEQIIAKVEPPQEEKEEPVAEEEETEVVEGGAEQEAEVESKEEPGKPSEE